LPLALAASSLPFAFHCAPMSDAFEVIALVGAFILMGLLYTLSFRVQ
jgi:hypothetical protein